MKQLAIEKVKFHLDNIKNDGRMINFEVDCIMKTIKACDGDLNKMIDTEKPPYKEYENMKSFDDVINDK